MALALAQTPGTASSSATAPASIAPALGSGSTANNVLFLLVAATAASTTPGIATPANWSLVESQSATGLNLALFSYSANPGGITAVTVTLSNTTGGGACAIIAEISGAGTSLLYNANTVVDQNGFEGGPGTSVVLTPYRAVTTFAELLLFALANGSATQTLPKTQEWAQLGATLTSTNAATINCTLSAWWATNGGPATPQFSNLTLSASVNYAVVQDRWLTTAGGSITRANNAGTTGIYVPQFYSGSTGG